jgi:hypothetical protein
MALWAVFMINEINILVLANPIYLYFYDPLQLIYVNSRHVHRSHQHPCHISTQSA